jgi:hypothetical protein
MPRRKQSILGNRELRRALALIAFGLVVLPLLVYAVGAVTLGTAGSGLWEYLKVLYGSLLQLRPSAWALVLGPYLLLTLLRFTSRPLRRRSG